MKHPVLLFDAGHMGRCSNFFDGAWGLFSICITYVTYPLSTLTILSPIAERCSNCLDEIGGLKRKKSIVSIVSK